MLSRKNIHALALAAVTVLLAGASLPERVGDNPAARPPVKTAPAPAGVPAGESPRVLKVRNKQPVRGISAAALIPVAAETTTPVALARTEDESTVIMPAAAGNGDEMSDALIEARIKNDMFARTGKPSYAIEVESQDGVVSLSGLSADRAHHDSALRIARQSAGVREVHDLMEIKPSAVDEK